MSEKDVTVTKLPTKEQGGVTEGDVYKGTFSRELIKANEERISDPTKRFHPLEASMHFVKKGGKILLHYHNRPGDLAELYYTVSLSDLANNSNHHPSPKVAGIDTGTIAHTVIYGDEQTGTNEPAKEEDNNDDIDTIYVGDGDFVIGMKVAQEDAKRLQDTLDTPEKAARYFGLKSERQENGKYSTEMLGVNIDDLLEQYLPGRDGSVKKVVEESTR